MDVREKLVELQDESDICPEGITSCIGCKYHKEYAFGTLCDVRSAIADKMIAHGVTAQECGEWVYDHWCEFKCSVCGQFSNSKPYKGKENYCPHCGANMMPQPPKGE